MLLSVVARRTFAELSVATSRVIAHIEKTTNATTANVITPKNTSVQVIVITLPYRIIAGTPIASNINTKITIFPYQVKVFVRCDRKDAMSAESYGLQSGYEWISIETAITKEEQWSP
jgi:hypothetical protein